MVEAAGRISRKPSTANSVFLRAKTRLPRPARAWRSWPASAMLRTAALTGVPKSNSLLDLSSSPEPSSSPGKSLGTHRNEWFNKTATIPRTLVHVQSLVLNSKEPPARTNGQEEFSVCIPHRPDQRHRLASIEGGPRSPLFHRRQEGTRYRRRFRRQVQGLGEGQGLGRHHHLRRHLGSG